MEPQGIRNYYIGRSVTAANELELPRFACSMPVLRSRESGLRMLHAFAIVTSRGPHAGADNYSNPGRIRNASDQFY